MIFGLPEPDFNSIKEEIKKHLGETKVAKLFVYGSRVKGNAREFSDIDLLLLADEYDEQELEKIDFESLDTPYKVDFVLDKNLFEKYREEIHGHMIQVEF